MGKVNTLLAERLKKKKHESPKMKQMAQRSAGGNLSGFSGIFSIQDLSDREKNTIETILQEYSEGHENISMDLRSLISITSEVKAINNQAAVLHGERIKKAHGILTRYRDGAFTAWLMATYGNRQTPYNFMQYYEFCEELPKQLKPQLEQMPRQAIYTLASRDGPFDKKQELVESYNGETKQELLTKIRDLFPLDEDDKRRQNMGDNAIKGLKKIRSLVNKRGARINKKQKEEIRTIIREIEELIQ
ncbi:MAG: CT583 family protein [Chlamydiales bacterium]|nr:CT583 family protein [Chlamydiia bacterium]MCP5507429.1 CT583 family protein [Chlamydiales bacterium]